MDYLIEIEHAKAVTEQAINDAKSLADKLPDGLLKVEALTLVSQLVQASIILNIRRPSVPCRLDFVSAQVPDLPEIESACDIEYLKGAPEDWDADYRSIWEKLQVESRNKTQWRKYALQLRSMLTTAN
ncbi:hypothetical protein [Flavobacterium sp.]|uniref:hypothetical protein n=1 Tax=Flavobacterium sp. TaxID=239 RepID=UPI00261FA8E9|nr:hypothetical protein [Flavobacterium sp.]